MFYQLFPHDISNPTEDDILNIQHLLSTNVIVLPIDRMTSILEKKASPLSQLSEIIRRQADLSKLSPFVINSATPREMYFGRVQEEARILKRLKKTIEK